VPCHCIVAVIYEDKLTAVGVSWLSQSYLILVLAGTDIMVLKISLAKNLCLLKGGIILFDMMPFRYSRIFLPVLCV
jgi:hypothetical protein